jgi:hypothetical protein
MRKRLVNIFIAVVAFASGTIYGFREGMYNYYHLEVMPRAVIGAIYHKQLEQGDFERAQGYYDILVDEAMDSYIWYEENGNTVLSSIFLHEFINSREEYLAKLVEFRKRVLATDMSHFLEVEAKTDYVSRAVKRKALMPSKDNDAKP